MLSLSIVNNENRKIGFDPNRDHVPLISKMKLLICCKIVMGSFISSKARKLTSAYMIVKKNSFGTKICRLKKQG